MAGSSLLQTQTFGYDDAGYLVSATDPDGDSTIVRDELNRAEEVETPSGVTLTFAYDVAGNRTGVADSKGGTQTSTFDLANRLTSRKLDGSAGDLRFDYTYTDRDELATVTRFSDLTGTTQEGKSSYAYDDGGRLVGIEHRTGSGAGTLIADYAYEYDLANRLVEKVENTITKTYGYDAIGQITSNNGTPITYDDTGNRTLSGYVTADGNRMTSDGVWTYAHDLDGNVVGKSKSGTAWTYEYDLRGQMVEASDGTTTVSYAYDAFGNRIGRTEDDGVAVVEEQYVQDGWDPAKAVALGTENFDAILDLEGDGDVLARHVFGPGYDDVVARQDAGGDVDWYVADRLGSVRAVFDNSGTVTNATGYDAFGGFLGGVPVDRYGYAGREWDGALGLQYNRARMYDPSTGRWMGEDGIRQAAGDVNLYRYVGNGATNTTDPSGLADPKKPPSAIPVGEGIIPVCVNCASHNPAHQGRREPLRLSLPPEFLEASRALREQEARANQRERERRERDERIVRLFMMVQNGQVKAGKIIHSSLRENAILPENMRFLVVFETRDEKTGEIIRFRIVSKIVDNPEYAAFLARVNQLFDEIFAVEIRNLKIRNQIGADEILSFLNPKCIDLAGIKRLDRLRERFLEHMKQYAPPKTILMPVSEIHEYNASISLTYILRFDSLLVEREDIEYWYGIYTTVGHFVPLWGSAMNLDEAIESWKRGEIYWFDVGFGFASDVAFETADVVSLGILGKGGKAATKIERSVDAAGNPQFRILTDNRNPLDELESLEVMRIGNAIAENSTANRAYSQIRSTGREVVLDFGLPPIPGATGSMTDTGGKVVIYVNGAGSLKGVLATLVHESSHATRLHRRAAGVLPTQVEEYRAFRREFLYMEGRRPTFEERLRIFQDNVLGEPYYRGLDTGKISPALRKLLGECAK